MKPVLVSYDCSDIDSIDRWIPEDPYDVDFWMNFTIGPDETEGHDYQVRIVTPKNIRDESSRKYLLVVLEYSWSNVLAALEDIFNKCQSTDWDDMSLKLSKYMLWEFEGYRP